MAVGPKVEIILADIFNFYGKKKVYRLLSGSDALTFVNIWTLQCDPQRSTDQNWLVPVRDPRTRTRKKFRNPRPAWTRTKKNFKTGTEPDQDQHNFENLGPIRTWRSVDPWWPPLRFYLEPERIRHRLCMDDLFCAFREMTNRLRSTLSKAKEQSNWLCLLQFYRNGIFFHVRWIVLED